MKGKCSDYLNVIYTTIQMFGVSAFFFKESSSYFFQQGCIKLIKIYSKDVYNIINTVLFYFIYRILAKDVLVSRKNIKQHNGCQRWQ